MQQADTSGLKENYRKLAIIVLNTLVLLVLANLALALMYLVVDSVRDRDTKQEQNRAFKEHGREKILSAYPGTSPEVVDAMLKETWGRELKITSTYFREAPFAGEHVNVSEHGFRHSKDQADWPPVEENLNVFVFGGSTTFGYGVTDEETIASYLQLILRESRGARVAVYNFGQGWYYSRLEMGLFQELASSGVDIDVAVFIDGLNEFTVGVHQVRPPTPRSTSLVSRIPMTRLATSIRRRLEPARKKSAQPKIELPKVEDLVKRYLESKRMIQAVAQAYEIESYFVWQPVPAYQMSKESPFTLPELRRQRLRSGYDLMAQQRDAHLIWCADLHTQVDPPHYVDRVHYTAGMHRALAERIAQAMAPKK